MADPQADVLPYRAALGRSSTQAAPIDLPAGGKLTLGQALELANEHNEQLSLEGENYAQALIDKDRAAAAFLPTVSFGPNYARRDRTTLSGEKSRVTRNTFEAPVNGAWEIYSGGRNTANDLSAAATVEQRRALLLDLQSTVMLESAAIFYQVLRSQRQAEVLATSLTLQEQRVQDIRTRRDAGVARPLDVALTEAQAASTQVDLITALSDIRNGRSVLTLLIGARVTDQAMIDDLSAPPLVEAKDKWLAQAMAMRQDLAAAKAAVTAFKHRVDAAVAQYYPSITLDIEALLTVDNLATELGWTAIIKAHLPLYTGGRIEADVRTAWSQLRQASIFEALTRRRIERDVELAYEIWRATRERVKQLNVEVKAAEQAFTQAEQSYNAGLATNLERLAAQDQLLAARLDLVSQELNWKLAYLALLRAAGKLGPTLPPP